MLWLLVTANIVAIPPIIVTLMMEELRSSESSVLTRATRRHIPEDGILQGCLCFPFYHIQIPEINLLKSLDTSNSFLY
jgi:hypothetical protein